MLLINLMKVYKELYFRNDLQTKMKLLKNPKDFKDTDTSKLPQDIRVVIEDIRKIYNFNYDVKSPQAVKYMNILDEAGRRIERNICELDKDTTNLITDLNINFEGKVYIVGGFCRDSLADLKPNDVDFCTDIPYEDLSKGLAKLGYKVKETGKQFLIINASKGLERWEIAALRSDRNNEGAVRGDISEDSKRRDFTVSALYYDIRSGDVLDPNGDACIDCFNSTLKFIGNPKDRIKEDPIRGLRFYNFVKRGWSPDDKSLKAVRKKWDYIYKHSNQERVRREIEKMVGL